MGIGVGLSILLTVGSCGSEEPDPVADRDPPDTTANDDAPLAPPFTLATLDGQTVALSDYRGKVVIVNFWATWCAPCREEMPLFDALRADIGPDNMEILAISVDEDPQADVPAFLEEIGGLSYPVLLGVRDVVDAYNVNVGLPTTYIVNREGRVVETLVGGQDLDVFEPLVRKHL
jgi:thiol-disulfide isomerase/thioredoxin